VIEEGVPFSITHANCRAIHDHPRNLADWQLEALAERGGVLGMMGLGFVVDPRAPTLARWLDHLDHAVAVMGIDHVGLGADFVDHASQVDRKAPLGLDGFTRPDDFPALAAALRTRGYDGDRLEAILSANWLRVLAAALP
jgi:membrane dipeptidase